MPPDIDTLTGGSLLLAWQLKDKNVLIVGGGDVASGRIESVLVADAHVHLVCPASGLHPLTKHLLAALPARITHHDRLFRDADLDTADMVLTAVDNVAQSRAIAALCRARRIPVNVADDPPACDFYFGSQLRDGPLQIMISTNGQSPKLANIIRRQIEDGLVPAHAGEAVRRVGQLRTKLRERAPGVGGELGKRRMRWMIDVCTGWQMDDLAVLDEEMMVRLLDDGWEKNKVPSLQEVGGTKHAGKTPQAPQTSSSALSTILPALAGLVTGATAAAFVLLNASRRAA